MPFKVSQLTQIHEFVTAHPASCSCCPQARVGLPCCQRGAGSSGPETCSWGRSRACHIEHPACQQGKGKGRQPTSVGSSQWRQVPIPCFSGINHTEIKDLDAEHGILTSYFSWTKGPRPLFQGDRASKMNSLAWLYLPTPPQSPQPSFLPVSTVTCIPRPRTVCDCFCWITPSPAPAFCVEQDPARSEPVSAEGIL